MIIKNKSLIVLVAIFIGVLITGCGNSIKSGIVQAKEIHPAHNDTIIIPVYAGQSCVTINKVRTCTNLYNYIPWVVHYKTAYVLKLESCMNASKCKHGNAYVDQTTYHDVKVGDFYDRQAGDNKIKYEKLHKRN